MGIRFNPLIYSGFDFTGTGSGPSPSLYPYHVEKITLTPTDISNKYVSLAATPGTANLTCLTVIGGVEQNYGPDFIVTGTHLDWNGLFLDGVLVSGDQLIIVYN